ncbi:MAG: GYDIA family GHMP kinase [Chitinophagales bacterium]
MKSFHANGKLLISGEYLILHGALSLAVPCKYGQRMEVEETDAEKIHWKSLLMDGDIWKEEIIDIDTLSKKINTSDSILLQVLKTTIQLKPHFAKTLQHKKVTTHLEFPPQWGLGSSSTLIHLIAQWSGADPLTINSEIMKGSGYDIACAGANRPILFKKDAEGAIWDTVHFTPPSPEKIFFIHLNRKQNSQEAIAAFNHKNKKYADEVDTISEISEALLFCDNFSDFLILLQEHEDVMQYVLQQEKVQTTLFSDFPGVIKSLGAWGGDFVMAASEMEEKEVKGYFRTKGFETIVKYNQMVLFI